MNFERFNGITSRYGQLRIGVIGDVCLDRYLEIDPALKETSIETGLQVHNVVRVRSQPGAAGTILNNLSALGVGSIYPIGFAGEDGEGFDLLRALSRTPGIVLDQFLQTTERRTFTYCKPLVFEPGQPPRELERLDSKNWTPTPSSVQRELVKRLENVADTLDGIIVLDQVGVPETGVVTRSMLEAIGIVQSLHPRLPILADSRRGLAGFPAVMFKMNLAELASLKRMQQQLSIAEAKTTAVELARANKHEVFVTLSENGILGASPAGETEHVPILPIRGQIDIVGAGDAVSANLTVALAAGATLEEALRLANAAASVVVHKLGTTGTASPSEIAEVMEIAAVPVS